MEQASSLPVLEVHTKEPTHPESFHILYNILLKGPFQYLLPPKKRPTKCCYSALTSVMFLYLSETLRDRSESHKCLNICRLVAFATVSTKTI
jgi:hypothetical protein